MIGWVYKIILPEDLLKEVNRNQGSEKKHQWFTQQGGRRKLAEQIERVEMIATGSESRAEFERWCKKVFKRPRAPSIVTA